MTFLAYLIGGVVTMAWSRKAVNRYFKSQDVDAWEAYLFMWVVITSLWPAAVVWQATLAIQAWIERRIERRALEDKRTTLELRRMEAEVLALERGGEIPATRN